MIALPVCEPCLEGKMTMMKEVAQQKRCVEANGPVKGATMDNFNFLIKQPYEDN